MPTKPKKLHIIIAGQEDSGKTTVAHLISWALHNAGVEDVAIIDDEITPTLEQRNRNLAALKAAGLAVTISTYCVHRNVEHVAMLPVEPGELRPVPMGPLVLGKLEGTVRDTQPTPPPDEEVEGS